MFIYRKQIFRGISQNACCPRPRLLPKPYHPSHQFKAYRSTGQGQGRDQAPRSNWDFVGKLAFYIYIYYAAHIVLKYSHKLLRDYGPLDDIANQTIFRVVPPKIVEPANEADKTLYQPITREKEIRLLVLEPGAPGDELKCHLINAELSWRTRYEALSYTWGDAHITRRLSCSRNSIDVTVSLYDALSDLRHPTKDRLLWVDAVCINQADNDEKAKQIRLMGDIYSRAWRVLIYLGKTDASVDGAMKSIRCLDWRLIPFHLSASLPFLSWFSLGPVTEEEVDLDPFINLLHRPWFKRTWVVQEATLSKRTLVICGNQSISWARLQRVVSGITKSERISGVFPGYELMRDPIVSMQLMDVWRRAHHPGISMPHRWFLQRSGQLNLLDLILTTNSFASTDPRDKIFGMLGITKEDTRSEYLTPNYSISPIEIFRRFVLWEIFHKNSLRVLGSSSERTSSQSLFPSWVPDFDRLDSLSLLSQRGNLAEYNASADLPIVARISNDHKVLYLGGIIVDTLHTVAERSADDPLAHPANYRQEERMRWYSPLRINKHVIEEARDIWLSTTKRLTQGRGPVPKADDILVSKSLELKPFPYDDDFCFYDQFPSEWEPFLRTLVCNTNFRGVEPSKDSIENVAMFVRLTLEGNTLPSWFVQMYRAPSKFVIASFLRGAMSRRFAGTDTGRIGYVPMRAKKGDVVVILYGAKVPFVLRREAGGRYSLVGECYMHGIMYGEALKIPENKEKSLVFPII